MGARSRCPGQDGRSLSASLHRCPSCGAEVELFSDERSRRCPSCRTVVQRAEVPSCVAWCASARSCLGEERWLAMTGHSEDGPEEPAEE